MDASYRWILFLHILAGSIALASFWIAAILRKGSPRHRRAGQVYLVSMIGVLASGVPLALGMIERGRPAVALFLTFLLLLTGTGCWNAWSAIRRRADRSRYFGGLFWALAVINALAGFGMIVLGIRLGSVLFPVFGGIGVFVLIDSIRRWRRSTGDPIWWLREHYGAMIGNGVATHIAFFSIGLRSLVPGLDATVVQYLAWFVPLATAFVAGAWLDRRYARRAAPPRAGRTGATANVAARMPAA